MDDCIFCKIVKGEIPCYKLYENDSVIAWLDIQPLSRGHLLVVPKTHYKDIHEAPEETLCEVMKVARIMANKIKTELHPEAILINQNNGEMAGQTIMHYHMHIKPIYDGTPCRTEEGVRSTYSVEEMKATEELLKVD
jgi:histidine triad (HIT) family protein